MDVARIFYRVKKSLIDNSPELLAGLGISGVVSTSYLTARSTKQALGLLEEKYDCGATEVPIRKQDFKHVWKMYIPPVLCGAATIAFFIGGNRVTARRTATALSLLSVSERAFTEYKEKVVEQIGEKKEQKVRDDIAQDRMRTSSDVVIAGSGTVLCYEMHTGRYFNCDMETLRKSQNTINAQMMRENQASLSDFYYLVGLPNLAYASASGWVVEKLMELEFSTTLSGDGRPCLAFQYNYVKAL